MYLYFNKYVLCVSLFTQLHFICWYLCFNCNVQKLSLTNLNKLSKLTRKQYANRVPSLKCHTASANCGAKHDFDKTKSTTYSEVEAGAKSTFQIQYGSGPVSGVFGVDKVTLADDYTVDKQTFAMADTTDGLGQVCEYGLFSILIYVFGVGYWRLFVSVSGCWNYLLIFILSF